VLFPVYFDYENTKVLKWEISHFKLPNMAAAPTVVQVHTCHPNELGMTTNS